MRRLVATLTVVLAFAANGLSAASVAQDAPDTPWLVMLYQNADDEVLEGDIFTDLNEAELVGSSDDVTIVSQLDRHVGAFDGDGDWTTAKRFLVTTDDDLAAIGSEEIEDLGEVDSGAPETLVDFAVWAMTTYPAQKYALILSDHGAGWVGGWTDDAPEEGSSLTINEIDGALGQILAQTGASEFEFVGFDACLMSQMEALAGIAPYAHYSAASEETEPAMGWAYAQFLNGLVNDPAESGAELATSIVDSYVVDDVRVQDDQARSQFMLEAYGTDQDPGPEQLGVAEHQDATLTAIDLWQLPPLMDALDAFAVALTDVDPDAVDQARTYAQSFENIFGDGEPASYIDLGSFAGLVSGFAGSPELDATVSDLQAAYGAAILGESHGEGRPGATGVTVFFPAPDLLEKVGSGAYAISYTAYASRFAGASLWDDFLRSHYTSEAIDPGAADPGLLDPGTGPGADLSPYTAPLLEETTIAEPEPGAALTMGPLEASADQVAAGGTIQIATRIDGDDVGYIYVESSRFDPDSDTYILEDRDFVAADDTQDLGGVHYPVWTPEDLQDFRFDWHPTTYSLSDGTNEAFALLDPSVYGVSDQDTEYDVRGTYTFTDTGETRSAIMTFDANLGYRSLLTFTGTGETGAPRDMSPNTGDTFTISEDRYELDPDGEWVVNEYAGDTLTFSGKPFVVTAYDSYPGEYSVGITASDLRDTTVSEFTTVHVTE